MNNVDITSIQNLIDVRNQLDRYVAPDRVDWHVACINNRWTKRALASAGFGYLAPSSEDGTFERWKPIFSVAEIGGDTSAASAAERRDLKDIEAARSKSIPNGDQIQPQRGSSSSEDLERSLSATKAYAQARHNSRKAVVQGINLPLFHVDLTSALQSAIANAELRQNLKGSGTAEL